MTVLAVPGGIPPRILLSSAGRFILPSSGSFAANGALSGITALRAAYPQCWMSFPAGALFAGSMQGTYFVQMSGTTAGTVFLDQPTLVDNAIPFPTNPRPIVAAGPGAYTQTTGANVVVLPYILPPMIMGLNGRLRYKGYFSNNNSAGTKIGQFAFAGATGIGGTSNTTNMFSVAEHEIVAQASNNAQVCSPGAGYVAAAASPFEFSADTTVQMTQPFGFELQMSVATDWCMWDWCLIELYQSNP